MYIPATDKLLHAVVGAAAALPGAAIAALALYLRVPVWPVWACALLTCALAAVAREVWNARTGGFFDWRDIAATLGGGAMVAAGTWLGSAPNF